jgi:hypothetical protein
MDPLWLFMPSMKLSGDLEYIAPIVAITKYMLTGFGTNDLEEHFMNKFGGKRSDEEEISFSLFGNE